MIQVVRSLQRRGWVCSPAFKNCCLLTQENHHCLPRSHISGAGKTSGMRYGEKYFEFAWLSCPVSSSTSRLIKFPALVSRDSLRRVFRFPDSSRDVYLEDPAAGLTAGENGQQVYLGLLCNPAMHLVDETTA